MSQQKILIAVVLSAGILLFSWLVLLPSYDAVSLLVEEINQVTTEIEKKNELFAALGKVVAAIEENRKKLEVVTTYMIPPQSHKEEIIVITNSLALRNQILIDNIAITESTVAERAAPATENNPGGTAVGAYVPTTVAVSLSCTGSYENFKSFLQSIERTMRIADVISISFGSFEKDIEGFAITFNMYTQ